MQNKLQLAENDCSADTALLSRVYRLILSWSDPIEIETASPVDLDQDAGEAVQTAPPKVEGASWFYHRLETNRRPEDAGNVWAADESSIILSI